MTGSLIVPALRYRDAYAAIDWLCNVLGMSRHAFHPGPDNTVAHAQSTFGGGMVMLGSASNHGEFTRRWRSVEEAGGETCGLCLIVTDDECRAIYARAKAAGAPIAQELTEPEYGGLAFACVDPEGHSWSVGSYNPWQSSEQEEERAA